MSRWESVRATLTKAGWTPTVEQGVQMLQSPHNSLVLRPVDVDHVPTRRDLQRILREKIGTLRGYRETGFDDPSWEGALADFTKTLECLDMVDSECSEEDP